MIKEKTMQQQIIDRYGEAEYFKELEAFLKKHQGQHCVIEYDYELNMPIGATYIFKPISVVHEHLHLMKTIAEHNRKVKIEEPPR